MPHWTGEYGFWDVEPDTLATARRYAADEDAHLWGGAWWQWRQSCGDPHAVRWSGGAVVAPTGTETHLNLLGCPGNVDLGPNDAFLDILGRGYPRAAPGRLTEVRSDPAGGSLKVVATAAEAGGQLVVWTPTVAGPDHEVHVLGLTDVEETAVPGGRLVTATVAAPGRYVLWVGDPDEQVPTTTTTTTTTTGSTPSTPSSSQPVPPPTDPGPSPVVVGPSPAAWPVRAEARLTG